MGGASVICSDKTGTLTKNEMYLTNFWNLEPRKVFDPKTLETTKVHEFMGESQRIIFELITCCNSSAAPNQKSGNPTEMAIINYVDRCGIDIVGIRQKYKKIADEPFSSDRKRMSTLIKDHQGKEMMLISGASELILASCD
jgi:magnesium-transporting ATPase (P-type)